MAPQRPTSPTSLLWAHQLKREHGFLLDRMRKIEIVFGNSREAAPNSRLEQNIEEVAKQVKLLQNKIDKKEDDSGSEVAKRVESIEIELQAMSKKNEFLERVQRKTEEDRKAVFNKERALLKRMADIEENMRRFESSQMERWSLNSEELAVQIHQILERLERFTVEAKREQTRLTAKVLALEHANEELQRQNKKRLGDSDLPATCSARAGSPIVPAISTAEDDCIETTGIEEQNRPAEVIPEAGEVAQQNAIEPVSRSEANAIAHLGQSENSKRKQIQYAPNLQPPKLPKKRKVPESWETRVTRSQAIKNANKGKALKVEPEIDQNLANERPRPEQPQKQRRNSVSLSPLSSPCEDANSDLRRRRWNLKVKYDRESKETVRPQRRRVIRQDYEIQNGEITSEHLNK